MWGAGGQGSAEECSPSPAGRVLRRTGGSGVDSGQFCSIMAKFISSLSLT